MSYLLNRTDGTILTELIDGQIDTTTTNLTLVGRNYNGYGEAVNENFIKLLENFANTAAPSNPLTGQLWWDTNEQKLKTFNGNEWKPAGGPFVQPSQPQLATGDLWIDNGNNQLYAFDGSDLFLIGPQFTSSQGQSGFVTQTIQDINGNANTIMSLYIGNTRVAVYSNTRFVPLPAQRIQELVTNTNLTGTIFQGINVIDVDGFEFRGIASQARALVNADGVEILAAEFLPANADGTTTGKLTVQNAGGVTIGLSENFVQKVSGNDFYQINQLLNSDLRLRVTSSNFSPNEVDAIYIDSSTGRVGIFTTDRLPDYTLDVEGDLRVTGELRVDGGATYVNVTHLKVEDKNIELAVQVDEDDNDVIGGDGDADEAGINVRSTAGDKTWYWRQASNSWTSNVNVNLANNTDTYKIAGVTKITNTSIDPSITSADGLTSIGTLDELDVDDLNFNDSQITTNGTVLTINTSGQGISLDLVPIKNVANPTDLADAANKGYVDTSLLNVDIVFSLDVTGLGTGSTLISNVRSFLDDLVPAASDNLSKKARIHTVSYSGSTVSGIQVTVRDDTDPDTGETLTISRIAVDSDGTQNESVVQDVVNSNTASGTISLSVSRALMVYESNGSTWVYIPGESLTY